MSKIVNKYLELKEIDSDKLYLFKSGKFFIFIGDDCDVINEYVVLKKVKFSNEYNKCGFPENVLDNYLKVFNNHHINYEIVEDLNLSNSSIEDIIKNIDINKITPLEALIKLKELKDLVNGK